MNHEKLSHIARNPSEISAEDARELEELTKNFPYFSLPFALLTRYYAVKKDYRYEDTLHKTALRVNDRAWLFDFVHGGETKTETFTPEATETAVEEIPGFVAVETTVETTEETILQDTPVAETALQDAMEVQNTVTLPEVPIEIPAETPGPETEETAEETGAEIPDTTEEIPEFDALPIAEAIHTETEVAVLEEPDEMALLHRADRIFEPDEQEQHTEQPVDEDAVFEEIEMFDRQPEVVAPVLMAEDESTLELLAELDLSGPMVIPDSGEPEEEPETEETETEKTPLHRVKMPVAGSVYNIEDYYPADEKDNGNPPSDFFSWLNQPDFSGANPPVEKDTAHDNKTQLIDKFISNPASVSRPKSEFFNPVDVAKKSESFPADVATETLAGVYLKQENFSGAIRIYEKLILKFPEKRPYFAALIAKIKEEHHL